MSSLVEIEDEDPQAGRRLLNRYILQLKIGVIKPGPVQRRNKCAGFGDNLPLLPDHEGRRISRPLTEIGEQVIAIGNIDRDESRPDQAGTSRIDDQTHRFRNPDPCPGGFRKQFKFLHRPGHSPKKVPGQPAENPPVEVMPDNQLPPPGSNYRQATPATQIFNLGPACFRRRSTSLGQTPDLLPPSNFEDIKFASR